MSRRPLIASKIFPYHIFNRSNNRDWFYVLPEIAWKIFLEIISESAARYGVEIHTFVLMSNHYHLLISTPNANLDKFMRYFQTETCRQIQRVSKRINHVFGNRYKWSLLTNPVAVGYAYKYVLRNPVRAGLSLGVEDYQFSSLNSLLNGRNDLPITERTDSMWSRIPQQVTARLHWLNTSSTKESEVLVSKALRRYEFQFSRGNEVRLLREELQRTYGVEEATDTFSAEK